MGETRYFLRWFLYGVLFEVASGATGHVNVEFEILQFDDPTGTSYCGSDFHSQRKCCDTDSQLVNCPTQCDTYFVICLGGISNGRCLGPMYSHNTPKLDDTSLYTTTHDNRLVYTFTWNQWHSGDIEYIMDLMDYDTSSRQDIIDNFTLTTSLNVSASYEQTKEQRFSFRNYASLDLSIRVWCQDGYTGPDCSQQCSPYDAFHVCNSHQAAELIPACNDPDGLTIRIPPSPTGATFNYSPSRIQQRIFDFISKEICPDATSLVVNILRFSLTRSIEFKATCDGQPVDNLLFTTHLYVMSLARKTQLHTYFPSLTVPVVQQKTGSGAHLYMMLEVVSYQDSSNDCSAHTCNVQINICTSHISNNHACTQYPMLDRSTFNGGNLTICDGVAASGTSNKHLIGSATWPVISTDIKYNGQKKLSQHNKAIAATYKASHAYVKARPYEMIMSDNTHRLAVKLLIWCAIGYTGDRCEYRCQASGNRECDKDGNQVCKSGYHGSSCTDFNECTSSPCQNGGTCQNTAGSFTCTCPSEWAGPTCETDIDECSMNYCGSVATSCTNTPGGYSCTCKSHVFNHNTCSDRNECHARPCKNGATCYNMYGSYHCDCTGGFNGTRCTDDIDECQLQVCGNHSTSCVNTVGSYNCSCISGWSGKSCQTDIDECTSKPCKYGGTCHNTPGSYRCSCVAGSNGTHCDDIDECKSHNTCHNNGTCVNLTPPDRFRCQCPSGWSGKSCQTDIDECTSKPCKFGTCHNTPGSYHCTCIAGSRGAHCDDIDECSSSHNPCQNQGTCVNLTPTARFRCECPPGLDPATRCLHDIDECKSDRPPCVHGTCHNTDRNYTCSCNEGWTGRNCSTDVNECHKYANICQNKGTCVNKNGGYAYVPCHNNGTCLNMPGSYSCSCTDGWSGNNCTDNAHKFEVTSESTTDLSEISQTTPRSVNTQEPTSMMETTMLSNTSLLDICSRPPCANNGTCVNHGVDYVCNCTNNWTGRNCTDDVDECTTDICAGKGVCVNTVGSYSCMHLGDAIHPACTGSSWNITANMTVLKEMYPTITSNHVFFGDNSCQGIEKGSLLLFQQGLHECLTSKRVSDGTLFYENILYYAIYDPINPFIIRQHKWTFTVECDVSTNEATSSHVHHETNSEHVTVTGHHPISMAFFTDPNFQHEIPGNPIHASIGSDVYVKVFTEEPDWAVKMRLHTCFTKPNSNADDNMIYYIIKDGCEVDSNTHIMSQSTHETTFVFQDFEYSTNREGLDISCNATFCDTKDFSKGCTQACRNLGGQAFIGK